MERQQDPDAETIVHSWDLSKEAEDAAIVRWVFKAEGEMNSNGVDNLLLLRINGSNADYRSVVQGIGDAGEFGEWNYTGLYVGRNGWGSNADFSMEYTLQVQASYFKTAYGRSTFAHRDPRRSLLGYVCNGFWRTANDAVSRVDLVLVGSGAIQRSTHTLSKETTG